MSILYLVYLGLGRQLTNVIEELHQRVRIVVDDDSNSHSKGIQTQQSYLFVPATILLCLCVHHSLVLLQQGPANTSHLSYYNAKQC